MLGRFKNIQITNAVQVNYIHFNLMGSKQKVCSSVRLCEDLLFHSKLSAKGLEGIVVNQASWETMVSFVKDKGFCDRRSGKRIVQ